MELNVKIAEMELEKAEKKNPGRWADHARYVAMACRNIAAKCDDMCEETAYILGMLHDIGRYVGVVGERHILEGYRYCMERGWEKAAQICITHSYMIQDIATATAVFDGTKEEHAVVRHVLEQAVYDDYDRLVQLCDALALPTGFCILEKRFVDVTLRYGIYPATLDRWKKTLELKELFDKKVGGSVYALLPGIAENSLR